MIHVIKWLLFIVTMMIILWTAGLVLMLLALIFWDKKYMNIVDDIIEELADSFGIS